MNLEKCISDVRVFHIHNADVMHEKSVANVMKHYNIPLAIRGNEVGKFTNPELQKLYDEFMAKGKKSLKNVLEVGIMIEVTDVEDLDKALSKATSADVITMLKFLRQGSYNYYNAFNKTLMNIIGQDTCKLIMGSRWC